MFSAFTCFDCDDYDLYSYNEILKMIKIRIVNSFKCFSFPINETRIYQVPFLKQGKITIFNFLEKHWFGLVFWVFFFQESGVLFRDACVFLR